ncbi:ABC transporter permease [Paenibacillus sp. S-38]|uniref:ABC transporter permease n=1 Tax=Paenibacillus sp. S-38 TaxID=3416710 RepID=UPI003CEA65D2
MSGFLDIIEGSGELGLLYALMALGVYITYRILDFPDLTVDGSFTTGGAIAAVLITGGTPPLVATAAAFAGGMLVGACTGLLHTKGKINALLSGILMMIALYSINLRIMDKKANISLFGMDSLLSNVEEHWVIPTVGIVVVLIKFALDWFLHTDLGLALRATGDNPRMIRSFGVHTDNTIIVGVSLSNGLVALSGALITQYSQFADVNMGIGMIVIGLASVIIGEALFGARTIIRATLAVLLGAIVYRLIVALALQIGLEATDMKLMTALIVIAALTVPKVRASIRQRTFIRKRAAEIERTAAAQSSRGGVR